MSKSQIETIDAAAATMTLSLDMELYPREVLYAAAYVFLDRAYVVLDRDSERFVVRLRGKQALDEETLRAMAGEFENELLAQALRHKVFKANQSIIERITALAIGGAAGVWGGAEDPERTNGGTPDAAADGNGVGTVDDSREFLDDPLGIAVPWESK